MKKLKGKIILIDDEKLEKDLLIMSLKELNISVDIEYFANAEDALEYLKKTKDDIFIIISDMNMPRMNGLELKKIIDGDKDLKIKSIPFIFSSTAATKSQLSEAYDYRLQGYFIKPHDIKAVAKQLETIITYWSVCIRPDSLI